ncbi:pyridoxal-dependent decarboxylase, exosortase A system-associated [Motiliproteus coralliicola]|uniref:Pyridoxal-dependent decarboxylase, exosortase A system-associated n=1 Tax=Motiliproteus coralliicola TaxID=2283196 RepID=A0A369WWA1_9GAMM|nr:pyridoxal-dependent decarboxylase, exosortase A system-associated [Motiliproteus coralliicola]RDE24826.1 pyridoxal-dependent decarboxylase, exosortase A system-associated [Motiliproteus coralliicola]
MTTSKPSHHSTWNQRQDGAPLVNGHTLTQVAAIAGQTPYYVYDRSRINETVANLRAALPDAIKLHYAIKANPMPALVQHLASLVDGLDVASQRELRVALATGTEPAEISFAGPGKSSGEIEAAVAAGIVVNCESMQQIRQVGAAAEHLGLSARLALRVNPAFELKASGMKMTGGAKPFGIDTEQLADAIALARELGIEPEGLHLFTGSQNLKPEAICEAHSGVMRLAGELIEQHRLTLRFVNIGGGLGIPYFPGEKPLDLEPVAANLASELASFQAIAPKTEIVMELGRYLVGEAGLYVCQVIDKKVSRGTTYLITNGGLHHHLSNSGNFGQVIRKNYPVEATSINPSGETELVTVVGPLCTPLDIVADKVELPRCEVGDLIVVRQSGAYGFSASPQGFLSHPEVVEVFL